MPPKIRERGRISKYRARIGTVETYEARGMCRSKEGVAVAQPFNLALISVMCKLTAGERRIRCPGLAALAEDFLDLLEHVLGEAAVGRDLAAKRVDARGLTFRSIRTQHIV